MSERPIKQQFHYEQCGFEAGGQCNCGHEVWNACIDAWEQWEKENPSLERLNKDDFKVKLYGVISLFWVKYKNIPKIEDMNEDLETYYQIFSDYHYPKDAVSVPTIDEIVNKIDIYIERQPKAQDVFANHGFVCIAKTNVRNLAQTIHSLITSKLKGQDNEAK